MLDEPTGKDLVDQVEQMELPYHVRLGIFKEPLDSQMP
jgi:hypothetical protein